MHGAVACSSFPRPGVSHCLAMLVNPCFLYVSGARRRVSLVGHHRFVTSVIIITSIIFIYMHGVYICAWPS
jgi:hypothetical protein